MLLENINYYRGLPFSVYFSNVTEEDYHYHREMEMTLLLRGSTRYRIHHLDYSLSKGDIVVVDTEDLHRIYGSSEDVLMLTLYIDLEYFTEQYPNIDYMIFACEDCTKESAVKYQELQNKISLLKQDMAEIMFACVLGKTDDKVMRLINQFVSVLANQFQNFVIEGTQFLASQKRTREIDMERLYMIVKYIYQNQEKKITLNDISKLVYLSPYYISHLIKATTGLNFQGFLNYTRVESAEKYLADGKLTLTQITQISEFCGFSSYTYFIRCFRNWHGITPSQYKKRLVSCERHHGLPFSEKEALAMLAEYSTSCISGDVSGRTEYHLDINAGRHNRAFCDFRTMFPLKIVLSSSDVLQSGYLKNEIDVLSPASISVSKDVFNEISGFWPPDKIIEQSSEYAAESPGFARTVSEAFRNIMRRSICSIRLSGENDALFSPLGLKTPYYFLYKIFSEIRGNIIEKSTDHMVIADSDRICILFAAPEKVSGCITNLHVSGISPGKNICGAIFRPEDNCYSLVETKGTASQLTGPSMIYIDRISAGTPFMHTAAEEILVKKTVPSSFLYMEIF